METPHGTVHVFTFKEGLLARAAHDLRLTLERFTVNLEGGALSAVFETGSLRVDGAVRDGKVAPDELGAGDRREIERIVRERVLMVDKYPHARFEARMNRSGSRCSLEGVLELVGQRRDVLFEAHRTLEAEQEWEARVGLVPSRWGIRPYTALLGAIRLADRIEVVVRLRPIA